MEAVEEPVVAEGAQVLEGVDRAEPLRTKEGGDPLLRDRRGGARPDLVPVREDHHMQGRAVGAHVRGQLADLREEALVPGPHRA